MATSASEEVKLREVHTAPDKDYFLEITSPSKAMTEASMNRQWRSRFEAEQIKMSDMTSHLAEYDVSFFSLSFHTKETAEAGLVASVSYRCQETLFVRCKL